MKKPETYHRSYTSATSAVFEYIESQGYQIDAQDWFNEINLGGRPGSAQPKRATIGLSKNGKELRKCLQMQIYRIPNENFPYDTFEINFYIL